ncbi:MAG: MASE1 domain-containing protein [Deltaproteobacteria bacterium]|nr:MASE1 domain-containing protein [Deltaproteobacteria bacterium]
MRPEPASARRTLALALGVAVLYFVTGRLGLLLADVQANATLIWPPTGLAIGALVLFGPRMAGGVALGAFAVNVSIGTAPAVGLAITTGNTLEALAAWACLHAAGFDPALGRMRDVAQVLAVSLLASALAATVGVGALWLGGAIEGSTFEAVWVRWWLGDAAGGAVFAPLVTVAARGGPSWRSLARRPEAWLVVSLLVAGALAAFRGSFPAETLQVLLFGPFFLIVWAGLRLGPRGAVLGVAGVSFVAVTATAGHVGPFGGGDVSVSVFALWAYITTLGGVGLLLAAAVNEREQAMARTLEVEAQRRELEGQMRHAQRLESLGVLAGGVAHDFNNLLAVIMGNAELLRDPESADEQDDLLDHIMIASRRASELCQQLLTYAGEAKPRTEGVDLPALVEEMTALLRSTLAPEVRLELEFAAEVPAVLGDGALLRQVVLNLLMNSAEALPPEGGTVKITSELRAVGRRWLDSSFLPSDAPAGEYVVLKVEDTGEGMSAETLERVFDPFFTTKFTGRGLGLAATLGAVRSLRGAIKVSSTPGVGTRFEVLLPPSLQEPRLGGESPSQAVKLTGRWLVVEDDDAVRRLAARMVRSLGGEVLEAVDADQALEQMEVGLGSLSGILVDLTLPGRSGREVAEVARSRSAGLPIVLMSGYLPEVIGDQRVVCLAKPFTAEEFGEALHAARDAVAR